MNQRLIQLLENRERNDALRTLQKRSRSVDFSSNDYLGLSSNLSLLNRIEDSFNSSKYQFIGSGGSRLLAGTHDYHVILENFLASFHKSESALLFNSGYTANLGLFSCLPQKGDTVIYDELIHTCIKDGVRLSNSRFFSFKHNDLESLKKKVQISSGTVYVVVESIYSMDGDIAPLKGIVELSKQYGFNVIVDEAHSTGIYGDGAGMCVDLGLDKYIFARVHTFGKAIGTHGACIVGSKLLKSFLINFSRPFIYTTSQPLHGLIATHEAYKFIADFPELIEDLHIRVKHFKNKLGFVSQNITPIQPVFLEGNSSIKEMAHELVIKGFDVRPVLSPTVPIGKERLRICIHANNTIQQIDDLAKVLNTQILPK